MKLCLGTDLNGCHSRPEIANTDGHVCPEFDNLTPRTGGSRWNGPGRCRKEGRTVSGHQLPAQQENVTMQRTTSGARLWPVMAVLAFLPFLREKTFADTMGSVPGPAVEGLVPNPDFTRGTEQPVGWKLRGGEGSWRDRSILEIIGTGTGSPHWESDPIPLISGATYRFQMRARQLSGSGCVISGPACANRDYSSLTDSWQWYGHTFRVPDQLHQDRLRLGQWESKMALQFQGARLVPALPIHRRVKGLVLGEGEMLQSGRYVFRGTFGYEGSNYHRALVQATASFARSLVLRRQRPGHLSISGSWTASAFGPDQRQRQLSHSGHLPRGGKSRSGKLATPGHGFLRGYSSSQATCPRISHRDHLLEGSIHRARHQLSGEPGRFRGCPGRSSP